VELGCLAVVVAEPAEMAHHHLMVACQLRQDKEIKAVTTNLPGILVNILAVVVAVAPAARAAWAAWLQDNLLALAE
jgi:hypothetical protein